MRAIEHRRFDGLKNEVGPAVHLPAVRLYRGRNHVISTSCRSVPAGDCCRFRDLVMEAYNVTEGRVRFVAAADAMLITDRGMVVYFDPVPYSDENEPPHGRQR